MKFKRFITSLLLVFGACAASVTSATTQINIKTELASPVILENSQEKNYLKISLTGFPRQIEKRSPINLALVIDRSTSMTGDRIERARQAAIMAVNLLGEEDYFSIIAYDTDVTVVIPARKVTDKKMLIKAIEKHIQPRGMTALFAGVSKGIDEVAKHLDKEQVNRIILLSDGQANRGPTSNSEMADLAKIAAKKGIAITTMGIGDGYNEVLMTTIAGYSDGNHTFVKDASMLELAFSKEFDSVMSVVAQDVTVEILTNDEVQPVRLLGRDGEIIGNKVKVKLNQLYANQEKYILLEVIPAKGTRNEEKRLASVNVIYDNLATHTQDKYDSNVIVRYSDSSDEVKKSVVDDVMADSVIQEVALEKERAAQLITEGKTVEAQKVLESNTAKLESARTNLRSPEAKNKVGLDVSKNRELSESVQKESASVASKRVKEDVYKLQRQSK